MVVWAIKYTPSLSLATRGESAEEFKRREQDLKEVVPAHQKNYIHTTFKLGQRAIGESREKRSLPVHWSYSSH